MENAVQTAPALLRGGQPWPLSVAAYRALGAAGLLPENTELLHGFCWLVLAPERRIEIYRKPEAGAYLERVVHESGDVLTSPVLSGLQLSVNGLFARR